MATVNLHPPVASLRVDADLDSRLSRWLWLVKWILVIPHYVVLAFLWLAFLVLSVVAFFAIAFTGRYPRALFDFNVGVLRWTWRVSYYAYGALGTDRYPPFTLADVEDYPARLHIPYPSRLSRGLVWVKWWLLAIPHYLIVSVLLGGGLWTAGQVDQSYLAFGTGLIGLLVLIAGVMLLVRGSYPRTIFDLVLGLDRWVLRVAAYSALMTDTYPPFKLDQGGTDPGTLRPSSEPAEPPGGPPPGAPAAALSPTPSTLWTGRRVIAVVVGVLLVLMSLGLLGGATAAVVADQALRDDDGYLTSPRQDLTTASSALVSDPVELHSADGPDVLYADSVLGDVRLRATGTEPGSDIFIGVGRTEDVQTYLADVDYVVVDEISDGQASYTTHPGTRTAEPPTDEGFWVASVHGPGTQSLVWAPEDGDWTVVVMNAAAVPGVSVEADIGATVPALDTLAWVLAIGGVVLLAGGVILIYLGVTRGRGAAPGLPAPQQPGAPTVS